jgi:UDP-N-acetyl-D-glucosamine dehydrogenase
MPAYVASRISEVLNGAGKAMRGAKVVVLGLAYKAGVTDVRESPALQVIHHLIDAGAHCSYHDPYVPSIDVSRRRAGDVPLPDGANEVRLKSVPLDDAMLAAADCVVVLTAHPDIDYEAVAGAASLVFDATGVTRPIRGDKVIRL